VMRCLRIVPLQRGVLVRIQPPEPVWF